MTPNDLEKHTSSISVSKHTIALTLRACSVLALLFAKLADHPQIPHPRHRDFGVIRGRVRSQFFLVLFFDVFLTGETALRQYTHAPTLPFFHSAKNFGIHVDSI